MVWFMLFFGGFVLPPLTGIMLNTVPEYHRGQANSLATLSYNLIGYFPAPSWYGLIASLSGHKETSHWPMVALLYSSTFTFVFVLLGMRSVLKKGRLQAKEDNLLASEIARRDSIVPLDESQHVTTSKIQLSDGQDASRNANDI